LFGRSDIKIWVFPTEHRVIISSFSRAVFVRRFTYTFATTVFAVTILRFVISAGCFLPLRSQITSP
jgi:hypothetical protein